MKKGVKILIIILALVTIGLISYIAVDKLILSKNTEEKKENNVVETEKVEESEELESSDKDVGARVLAEITDEGNLKRMNINKDDISIFKYASIDTEYGPMYFILISFQEEGKAENGVIYYTRNTEGNTSGVSYTQIENTKYLSDSIAYDSNKKILRLSATYHDRTRVNYFELEKGGLFREIDLAVKDGSKEYNFKELKLIDIDLKKDYKQSSTDTTKKDNTESTETTDYSKYVGRWNGTSGDVEIKVIGNNYISFSWSVLRTGGMDDVTIPFSEGKGTFYFQGYKDANYNNVNEDDEHYSKKGTIELKDNSVIIKIEDTTSGEISENIKLDKTSIMYGAVYLEPGTYTHSEKE